MDWPVFTLLKASAAVKAIVGTPPDMKAYEDVAPQDTPGNYITWSTVGGAGPLNYAGESPTMDRGRVQLDCWSDTKQGAVDLAKAARDAIEPSAHMISAPVSLFDPQPHPGKYRMMLEFEFFTSR